jgi:hypothetical protein
VIGPLTQFPGLILEIYYEDKKVKITDMIIILDERLKKL